MHSLKSGESKSSIYPFYYGYVIVTVAFFIMVVMHAVHSAFGVFFTPLLAELGWTRATISGAFSLSWIIQGLLTILMGELCDRISPRMVLMPSGFLRGLGYLLTVRTEAVWELNLYYGAVKIVYRG